MCRLPLLSRRNTCHGSVIGNMMFCYPDTRKYCWRGSQTLSTRVIRPPRLLTLPLDSPWKTRQDVPASGVVIAGNSSLGPCSINTGKQKLFSAARASLWDLALHIATDGVRYGRILRELRRQTRSWGKVLCAMRANRGCGTSCPARPGRGCASGGAGGQGRR